MHPARMSISASLVALHQWSEASMIGEPLTIDRTEQLGSTTLNDSDLALLGEVDSSLFKGLQLEAWWEQTNSTNSYSCRFPAVLTFNRPNMSFTPDPGVMGEYGMR